jgi:hypothetical protein
MGLRFAGIRGRGGQAWIRRYRRLGDRVLNPQQLAHPRAGTHWDGPFLAPAAPVD